MFIYFALWFKMGILKKSTYFVFVSLAGIAYLSRVCNSYAASVNEESYNAMIIHIAAHELTHR